MVLGKRVPRARKRDRVKNFLRSLVPGPSQQPLPTAPSPPQAPSANNDDHEAPSGAKEPSQSQDIVPSNEEGSMQGRGEIIFGGIKTALQAIANTSDVFPPLKSVTMGLLEVFKAYDGCVENKEEFENLNKNTEALLSILEPYRDDLGFIPPEMKVGLGVLAGSIENNKHTLKTQLDPTRPKIERALLHPQDKAAAVKVGQRTSSAVGIATLEGTLHNRAVLKSLTEMIEKIVHANATAVTIEQAREGWNLLVANTAPNALHDSKVRYDPPKCDENTRIKVINEIFQWLQDRNAPQSLLYMTGAAGAGKSALQQTVAERCVLSKILAASFFFNVGDATRNNTDNLIPTLAYQLGAKSPTLRRMIGEVVHRNPLIFDQSFTLQMQTLIIDPLSYLSPSEFADLPHAILIDGLDECRSEDMQKEFLLVLHQCITNNKTPFRFFITSRPEMVIRKAIEPGGHLHKAACIIRISDDDRYDATADIRRTVTRSLRELGETRGLEETWFNERDVDKIVEAASGQYVFGATVIRYVSQPRGDPIKALRAVLEWAPGVTQSRTRPFASLDSLYAHILSKAKEEYEAVDTNDHDFLPIFGSYCYVSKETWLDTLPTYDQILGHEVGTYKSIIHDLRSLVTVNGREKLVLYHKSFVDFLIDEGRAGSLCTRFNSREYFISCCLRRVEEFSNIDPLPFTGLKNERHDSEKLVRLLAEITLVYIDSWDKHSTIVGPVVDAFIEFSTKDNGAGWVFIDKIFLYHLVLSQVFTAKGTVMLDTLKGFLKAFSYLLPLMKDRSPGAWAIAQGCCDRWPACLPGSPGKNEFIRDITPDTRQKLRRYYDSKSHGEADRVFLHEVHGSLAYQPPSSSK
ncbi:hypothetical protein DFP72DRAFT_1167836 [Ephemerocybe angulata]|uniref:Nephrocystin 3-like N-terminal domain-containing protein n=1 Tax=Ephemerocybe angulata TaxID=980116 RepID=A0A8H6M7R8_9AGAR|nr:hypothetical protein DFP72DRAFT_1167836 [Tulosesus angulatus]